jgi:uncharacterized membrane protein
MTATGMAALGQPATGTLEGFLVFAAAVWVGGLVAIFVVARVAQRTLRPRERVAFFRGLGRAYGPVGGIALAVALGCGAALLGGHAWDGTLIAATVLAACLVAVTAAGVVQARRMTRIRQAALRQPGNAALAASVRRGAVSAAALRAAIAAFSLALIALGVLLAP